MGIDTFEAALERNHVAVEEFMHGNTAVFKEVYSRRFDATLANPFGGVARGWDEIPGRLDRAASHYRNGDVVSIETISSHHDSGFGYAIEIERVRGRVGSRQEVEEFGVRTTSVFRREESGWKLVHRHADPAVELRLPEDTF